MSSLGESFRRADAVNKIRLKHAFPDYFEKYAALARSAAGPRTVDAVDPSAADPGTPSTRD